MLLSTSSSRGYQISVVSENNKLEGGRTGVKLNLVGEKRVAFCFILFLRTEHEPCCRKGKLSEKH